MSGKLTFLRVREVKERTGKSRSSLYKDITDGLLTKPLRIGVRAVAWPEHEIEKIMQARLAGMDDAGIRRLVVDLMAARTSVQELRA